MLSSKPIGTKYSKEAQKMTVQDHCGWTDDQLNSTCKRIYKGDRRPISARFCAAAIQGRCYFFRKLNDG